jgi:hypothetical protein
MRRPRPTRVVRRSASVASGSVGPALIDQAWKTPYIYVLLYIIIYHIFSNCLPFSSVHYPLPVYLNNRAPTRARIPPTTALNTASFTGKAAVWSLWQTLCGWATAAVADEVTLLRLRHSCGWATGITLTLVREFTCATAKSKMIRSCVSDVEKFIPDI